MLWLLWLWARHYGMWGYGTVRYRWEPHSQDWCVWGGLGTSLGSPVLHYTHETCSNGTFSEVQIGFSIMHMNLLKR